MGSEKHLVHTLTGLETPARALTADIGVVVHNIATAFAVHEAVKLGRPLISRILTVSGGAIAEPKNLKVPLGTPIADLIAFCGGLTCDPQELLSGGPMMGQPLRSTEIPTVKGMTGILARTPADTRRGPAVEAGLMDCIGCGSCAFACPSRIPLVQSFHFAKGHIAAEQRAQQRGEEAKRLVQQKEARQVKLAAERRAMMEKKKAAAAKARAAVGGASE
jgi:electron transport complex protein RnfC